MKKGNVQELKKGDKCFFKHLDVNGDEMKDLVEIIGLHRKGKRISSYQVMFDNNNEHVGYALSSNLELAVNK